MTKSFITHIQKFRTHPLLSLVMRVVIAAVFIFAGLTKINQPGDFAFAIQNYQIIPPNLTNLLAVILPWLEIFCGLALLLGYYVRGSAMILSGLTVVFIISVSRALISGLEIDCGCYGNSSPLTSWKLLEDGLILLACLHLWWYPSGNLYISGLFKRLP